MLAPYQVPIVAAGERFVAFEKGRRIGGSWAVALRAANRARQGVPQHIFSASADQAADLLATAAKHLHALDRIDPDPDSRIVDVLSTTVRLANGVELRSYADNPRAARGAEGDVTLDEFAFARDQRALWGAIKAVTDPTLGRSEGYRVTVVTTPWAEGSLAHQMCVGDRSKRDPFRRWRRFHVSLADAVGLGFPRPMSAAEQAAYIEQVREETADEEAFAREYDLAWGSGEGQLLSFELLNGSRYEPADMAATEGPRVTFAGVDIGRRRHRTAIAKVVRIGEVLFALPVEPLKGVEFSVQERAIGAAIKAGAVRCHIDSTGLGMATAEALEKTFPGKAKGFPFTGPFKAEIATGLRLALEQGRLRLPFDRDLLSDLASLERRLTTAGNVVYEANEGPRGHADRAWALALAVHAAARPVGEPGCIGVPRHKWPDLAPDALFGLTSHKGLF